MKYIRFNGKLYTSRANAIADIFIMSDLSDRVGFLAEVRALDKAIEQQKNSKAIKVIKNIKS